MPFDRTSHAFSPISKGYTRQGKLLQELWLSSENAETRIRLDA